MVGSAQIWTLIGVFTAVMGLMVTLTVTQVAGLRSLMEAKFDGLERTTALRFDHLDRDVQAISTKVFREDR